MDAIASNAPVITLSNEHGSVIGAVVTALRSPLLGAPAAVSASAVPAAVGVSAVPAAVGVSAVPAAVGVSAVPAAVGAPAARWPARWLARWARWRALLWPARDDGGCAICHLAHIGVWRQPAGTARVELSEELRALLAAPARATDEAQALSAMHPDDRAAAAALLRRARITLEPAIHELRVLHPQRGLRHTRWEVRVETDRQGRALGLTAIVQDVTDWRLTEERRRQASRMDALGQLAAGLAHDFNNLLHTVVLNLDMLEDGAARPHNEARTHEMVQRARGATERGAELTAQLLAFAGKHPAERQPLDLFQAVQHAAAAPATTATLDSRGVAVCLPDVRPAPDGFAAFVVEADPMLLRASLQTLLARARAASPDGGVVRVTLARARLDAAAAAALAVRPGPYAEISVSDAGEETPPELLPRLFEPFFRAVPDGTDPSAAGVGLAMVHGFARTHGGAVALEGATGHGTTARLLLPMASDSVRRALHDHGMLPTIRLDAAQYDGDAGPLDGLRVLLVEDDPEVRETTALLLLDDGADVTTAEDAPSALALLAGPQAFDLLLSDVVLPGGLSGIDVVERAAHLRPGLPALLASGYAAPAQELGRPLPADVILLRKPYRHADLLAAIASTLPQSHRRSAA